MRARVLLLKLVNIPGPDGEPVWTEVRGGVAKIIEATERPLRERMCRQMDNMNGFAESKDVYLKFRWLVGESRTWNGPASLRKRGFARGKMVDMGCALCNDAPLPMHAYCLGCDRCGDELRIPSPIEKGRIRKARVGKLRGGCGGKK